MSNSHLSATPGDPYQWRESVLSTRSLSYLSTADAMGSPHLSATGRPHSRSGGSGMQRAPTTDGSEYSLEMVTSRERDLKDIPELPDSVAESTLFMLPREIRDRVYSLCLTAQGGLPVEWPTLCRSYALCPQLLRTCKIIFSEAAPLLYTINNMTFHHPSDANVFVRAISSPLLGRQIVNLSLHIKAQDTRLWMPYLTSRDNSRSLKEDFPSIKELSIRFRSNKWQHSMPPEVNMELWSEDSRLDEVIDGLRHVFLPDSPHGPKNEREFEAYISNHPSAFPLDPSDPGYKKQWLDIQKARTAFTAKQKATPTIKVVCACRVHVAHFAILTSATPPLGPDLSQANNGTGVIQQTLAPPTDPPPPVEEGEPFRGFTPIDLRAGMKKLHDPELGSANVARTPFADKNGVLLSLEIHCLDPKRDNAAEQRMV